MCPQISIYFTFFLLLKTVVLLSKLSSRFTTWCCVFGRVVPDVLMEPSERRGPLTQQHSVVFQKTWTLRKTVV